LNEETWVVVGNGNQGSKHFKVLGTKCIAVIDTDDLSAGLYQLRKFYRQGFENLLVATPEFVKMDYVREAMQLGLNIVVEKPMSFDTNLHREIEKYLKNGSKFLTVYDHLTDSNIARAIEHIGNILKEPVEWSTFHLEYGFGTRNLIRKSPWMDFGSGPWELVSPHLLKIAIALNVLAEEELEYVFAYGGLRSPTQVVGARGGKHSLNIKTSYTSWKNTFRLEFCYEGGLIQVEGLEKWGNGVFRRYWMDFSKNMPVLVESAETNSKASYVERVHMNLRNVDMRKSLDDDKVIWYHLQSSRSALTLSEIR
jgi:predicted dehydrogenase